jgi:hypothetical protein
MGMGDKEKPIDARRARIYIRVVTRQSHQQAEQDRQDTALPQKTPPLR